MCATPSTTTLSRGEKMSLYPWQRALARSAVYEYLSAALLYPEESTLTLLQESAGAASHLLGALYGGETAHLLHPFQQAVESLPLSHVQEAHVEAFGHTGTGDCPPYEGEYGQGHIFLMSQSLADLGGFYGAFGLELTPEVKERLDHISVELEFMHVLALKESYALKHRHGRSKVILCRDAQQSFLKNHLGNWGCSFADRLGQHIQEGPYYHLSLALGEFLRRELAAWGLEPGQKQPGAAPLSIYEDDMDCAACPIALTPELGGTAR